MNLALHHLFCGMSFSAQILEIEGIYKSQSFGAFWEEILHNALGVAILTAAYENAMQMSSTLRAPSLAKKLSSPERPTPSRRSDRQRNRSAQIQRGSARHSLRQDVPYGDLVIQNVDALIKLRNAVVHFRPEWFTELGAHETLSRRLNQKFDPLRFPGRVSLSTRMDALLHHLPVGPSRRWWSFFDYFCTEAGIANPLDPFRERYP
ncbi:MAG: hypothetical protein R3E55_15415 [Burkholderiaceae bacterium]